LKIISTEIVNHGIGVPELASPQAGLALFFGFDMLFQKL